MTKEQLLKQIAALKQLPCSNPLLFPDGMTVKGYKMTMLHYLLIDYATSDNDIAVAVEDLEESL